MKQARALAVITMCASLVVACRQEQRPSAPPPVIKTVAAPVSKELPFLGTLPEMKLVDQNNVPFTLERMHGKAWIANFIFTTCHMACPMLSARMGLVQSRLKEQSAAVQLLSISILPDTDTPPVLKEYGVRYHQDPARWTFVTGKTDALFAAVSESFKPVAPALLPSAKPGSSDFISLHGEMFVLLDGDGHIRGYYRKDDAGVDRLIADAIKLSRGNT